MATIRGVPMRRWRPLTAELANGRSPVTLHLRQRFPYLHDIQRRYRESVGVLTIDSGGASPGTLGTAFDWSVRFLVQPRPSLRLAVAGLFGRFPQLLDAAVDLATQLGVATERGEETSLGVERFDGPSAGAVVDEAILLPGCWALALLTDVYRLGGIPPGSALQELDRPAVRAADLLALASPAATAELGQLRDLARTALLPRLAHRQGLWATGPLFVGSRLMNADADLVAGGLLLELKTSLGDKRADGSRRAGLETRTLHQLLGYVLLDFTDEFDVKEVGLYAARYGHLAVWPLSDLLPELAGRPVDLATEREAFRAVLLGASS